LFSVVNFLKCVTRASTSYEPHLHLYQPFIQGYSICNVLKPRTRVDCCR